MLWCRLRVNILGTYLLMEVADFTVINILQFFAQSKQFAKNNEVFVLKLVIHILNQACVN